MGCSHPKVPPADVQAAAKRDETEPSKSVDAGEASRDTGPQEAHAHAGKEAPPSGPRITAEHIRSILQEVKAHPDQIQFFEAWNDIVFMGLSDTTAGNVIVSTDLTYVEVRIRGAPDIMRERAAAFTAQCAVPSGSVDEMEQLTRETKAESVTLWCKFKNVGSRDTKDSTLDVIPRVQKEPSIDAGFIINSEVEWVIADMLMPAIDDQDALRDYAVQELQAPSSYGSSIFPTEPEKHLTFEMSGGAPKKSLLSAFFFFKSLGFAKPEDSVLRVLSSCQAKKFIINIFMGPKGLTRLSVSLSEPTKAIAPDLADCLRREYHKEGLERIGQILGGAEVEFIDYIADSNGYSVGMGFILSGYDDGGG